MVILTTLLAAFFGFWFGCLGHARSADKRLAAVTLAAAVTIASLETEKEQLIVEKTALAESLSTSNGNFERATELIDQLVEERQQLMRTIQQVSSRHGMHAVSSDA